MQLFLLGYIIISICEIFTVGEFPLADNVRIVSLRFPMEYLATTDMSGRLLPEFTLASSPPRRGFSC
jgi:hypothetical protein